MRVIAQNDSIQPNILVYGPAGTGKSYAVTTFSGPVLLIQTEPGLVSALANKDFAKRVKDKQSYVVLAESWQDIDGLRFGVEAWLKQHNLDQGWKPELVVLDSITFAAEFAREEILRRMPSRSGVPELQHWMLITDLIRAAIRGLVRSKVATLLIAQADVRDIEEPGSTQQLWLPGMPGRYATKIAHDVDYLFFSRRTPDGRFVVDTQAGATKLAKTRAVELDKTIELNLDNLIAALR